LDNAWNFATGLVMATAAVVVAAPAVVEGAIAGAETAMLKATVACVNSAICATVFGLGGAAGAEAANNIANGNFAPESFTEDEIQAVQSAAQNTGLDLSNITFWRGEGAPLAYDASALPGTPNITIYDGFFQKTGEQQIKILLEEFAHTLQQVDTISSEAITAAEEAAKRFAGSGGH
jgi:hypothetical protein